MLRESERLKRNETVLSVLGSATSLLKRLAFQFGLEYDEIYQMAAEAALLNYEKAQASQNVSAYLYGVIRNVLWYKPNVEPTLSLDMPQGRESGATYADMLPAPTGTPLDPGRVDKKTRALYASLRQLPLEAQRYLARVHDLSAYQPKRPREGRYAGKGANVCRSREQLSRFAYHALRSDKRLAHAICGDPLVRALDFERDFLQFPTGEIQQ